MDKYFFICHLVTFWQVHLVVALPYYDIIYLIKVCENN